MIKQSDWMKGLIWAQENYTEDDLEVLTSFDLDTFEGLKHYINKDLELRKKYNLEYGISSNINQVLKGVNDYVKNYKERLL